METLTYNPDKDFERACQFLHGLFQEIGRIDHWLPQRFENGHMDEDETYCLWVNDDDEIIGILTTERSHYFPNSNDPDCLREMLRFIQNSDDVDEVYLHCTDTNELLSKLLITEGYQREKVYGYMRIFDESTTVQDNLLPAGYYFQQLTPQYHDVYAKAVRAVFGHTFFDAEIVRYLQSRSFWYQDLDLMIVTDAGEIASFATFRYNRLSKTTELEPLGTMPDHRGKGLAKAIIFELVSRLKSYDSNLLYIGGAANTPAANKVYDDTGFTAKIEDWIWV